MKIAIAGFGIEGESNYHYWANDHNNQITIVDQKQPTKVLPAGVAAIISQDAFEKLQDFDLVVRTAGLSPEKIKTNGKVWSATNEFFAKCPAEIIGVTGTKGKGTTASLIASILEAAGKKVWLLGNIGVASLDNLSQIKDSDIVVYELSSFQLWDVESSPHIAVVLGIEPEHLDVHIDFEDYVNAKSNIRKYQKLNDVCVFHPTNELSRKVAESSSLGKTLRYGVSDDGGVYEKDGWFLQNEHKICSTGSLQLIGQHNIENACAAITVARLYGITDEIIDEGLKNFKGLPYRLEFVREIDGIKYYNDSFSSAVPSAISAIKSFDQPEILILGGVDRGANFDDLARAILDSNNIKQVIIIGQIRHKLAKIIGQISPNTKVDVTDAKNMGLIVKLAKSYAVSGDVIVLSPGCASFDMFKDFYDRGDQFRNEVNKL